MINLSNILSSSISKLFSGYFKFFEIIGIGPKGGVAVFVFLIAAICFASKSSTSTNNSNNLSQSNTQNNIDNANYNKYRNIDRATAIQYLRNAGVSEDLIKYATLYDNQEYIAQEVVKIGQKYSNRML